MKTGEFKNVKFGTTEKIIMRNKEKDRVLLNIIAIIGSFFALGFLIGRKGLG